MFEDDDDEDDADLFSGSGLHGGGRSMERLPESDEDEICSGSDLEPDIGVDIDNPEGYDTDLDIDGEGTEETECSRTKNCSLSRMVACSRDI